MADYIWTGDEGVQCEIEIEPVGDHRPADIFRATARRIQRDGLLPLAWRDRQPVEYVETSVDDALTRAKRFLDRRFGYGTIEKAKGATVGMRMFPLQQVPDEVVIAEYARYGCPVCRIGEPDDDKMAYWLEHAAREHGYVVVSDQRETAPGIPESGRHFRVVRLRYDSSGDGAETMADAQAVSDASLKDDG